MRFINADCEHICVENPMPSGVFQLPKQSQTIQPYMFGHPFTKKTYLWLKNLPELQPTDTVEPIGPYCPSGTSRKIKEKYGSAKRGEDAKNRAKTFKGVGDAMASQWGAFLIQNTQLSDT